MAEKAKKAEVVATEAQEVEATEVQTVEATEVQTVEAPEVSEAQVDPEKFLKDFNWHNY